MTSMRIPDAMHDADRNIIATVRALKAAQRKTTPAVLEPMHMSRNVWFSRMRGETSFTAAEVAGLARLFGVRISDLYEGRVVLPEQRTSPDGGSEIACYRPQYLRPWVPRVIEGFGLTTNAKGNLRSAVRSDQFSVSSANDHPVNVA